MSGKSHSNLMTDHSDLMPRVTLSGNTVVDGAKTFTTGTGNVLLNGATTVADSKLAFEFVGREMRLYLNFFTVL